jgi:hypothetical protein
MSELPVEEGIAKPCDAMAAMPKVVLIDVSPSHDAYGQPASFYHLRPYED